MPAMPSGGIQRRGGGHQLQDVCCWYILQRVCSGWSGGMPQMFGGEVLHCIRDDPIQRMHTMRRRHNQLSGGGLVCRVWIQHIRRHCERRLSALSTAQRNWAGSRGVLVRSRVLPLVQSEGAGGGHELQRGFQRSDVPQPRVSYREGDACGDSGDLPENAVCWRGLGGRLDVLPRHVSGGRLGSGMLHAAGDQLPGERDSEHLRDVHVFPVCGVPSRDILGLHRGGQLHYVPANHIPGCERGHSVQGLHPWHNQRGRDGFLQSMSCQHIREGK